MCRRPIPFSCVRSGVAVFPLRRARARSLFSEFFVLQSESTVLSRADIGWNSFTHGTPSRAASKRESVFPFCSCFRVVVRRLFLFLRLYFSLVALASSGPDLTSRPRPTGAVHDVTSSTCKGDAATFRATPAEPYRSSLPLLLRQRAAFHRLCETAPTSRRTLRVALQLFTYTQRCAHRAFGWSAEPSLRSELGRDTRAAGLRPRRSCAPAHAAKGTFASSSVLGLKPDSELVDVTQAFGRGVSKGHTYHYRVNP